MYPSSLGVGLLPGIFLSLPKLEGPGYMFAGAWRRREGPARPEMPGPSSNLVAVRPSAVRLRESWISMTWVGRVEAGRGGSAGRGLFGVACGRGTVLFFVLCTYSF